MLFPVTVMRHDSPEYNLIAAALTGHPHPSAREWNWDHLVDIGAREDVLPALHGKLPCPADVADFLDAIHGLNSLRNRQLLSELEELTRLLNTIGIEPVLLKGAAYLAAGVYDDPAARFLRDIDLLVPRRQCSQAYDLIAQAGYESFIQHPADLVAHHHPVLAKANCFPVEIHHRLGLGACHAILNPQEVVDASTPIRLGQATARLPAPHHLMTHLIMHSQVHHGSYYRIWPTLRSMLDLVRLNRRLPPDWNDVRQRFARHAKSAVLNVHLLQASRTLGLEPPFPLPDGGVRWLHRRILWRETRLKYLDPVYMASRLIRHRVSLSWLLLKDPAGRKHVLMTPFRASFYRELMKDLK
jgi:hypothetical protein